MDIPLELRLTLRPGTVYYLKHRELDSAEPHYFIVLSNSPLKDKVVLMNVLTSKVENQRRRIIRRQLPAETLVEITPVEYSELTKESCVNCNQVFTKPLAEIIQLFPYMTKKPNDLPKDLLRKILEGVEASPLVSETEKKLIRGES